MMEKAVTEKKKPVKKKPAVAVKKEKPAEEKAELKVAVASKRYIFAIGRRKTATAKVKMMAEGTGEFKINDRAFAHYFPTEMLRQAVTEPLVVLGLEKSIDATAIVTGGGTRSQAGAMALGLARALIIRDPASKTVLKKHGLMTRDARQKERKKPGLKRARRAPQWQKR